MRLLIDGELFANVRSPDQVGEFSREYNIDIARLSIHPDDLSNYNREQFNNKRRDAYNEAGCTTEALAVALFENNADEIARLKQIQMQVKAAIPKPEKF